MAHSDSEVRDLLKLKNKPNIINEIKEDLIHRKKNERSGKDNPTKKNIIDPNDDQRDNNKRDPKDGPYHAYNSKPCGSKDRSPGRKRKHNDCSEPEDSEEEEESNTSSNSEGDDSESSSPASSDDSDDNDEGSSDNEEFFKGISPPRKRRRTAERRSNPKSKEEKSSWKLSNSQAKYTVKNFNSYVSEKTLRESIWRNSQCQETLAN